MTDPSTARLETKAAANGEIFIAISQADKVYGTIRNGKEGVIKWIHEYKKKDKKTGKLEDAIDTRDIVRFNGEIGKVYKIDNVAPAIGISVNNEGYVFDLQEAVQFFRSKFALSSSKTQYLTEILTSYIFQQIDNGKFELYASSPIIVLDSAVKVNYEQRHDVATILKALINFYPFASHQDAYKALFAWTIVSPLHDELKRGSIKGIQTPITILTGKTKGGKTTLGNLFIGKGYGLKQDDYFYPYNRVATRFVLMKHLGESNLPALFDDLPANWILTHKEDIKSYVQTGHFGDRGRGDQTLTEYRGRRSFIGTINDDIRVDDDLALSLRLLLIRFTEYNRQRKDKKKFDAMFDSLPDGFMYEIFRAIFEGKNITDILSEVERFEGVEDWINYGISKINELCDLHGIAGLPEFKSDAASIEAPSNALEIALALKAEFKRIEHSVQEYQDSDGVVHDKTRYQSRIAGEIDLEYGIDREFIYFTGAAFKQIANQLGRPYSNASNFLNNVYSSDDGVKVENEGKMVSRRMNSEPYPVKAYKISIPYFKEDGEQ
jgi:hypothetical protein